MEFKVQRINSSKACGEKCYAALNFVVVVGNFYMSFLFPFCGNQNQSVQRCLLFISSCITYLFEFEGCRGGEKNPHYISIQTLHKDELSKKEKL